MRKNSPRRKLVVAFLLYAGCFLLLPALPARPAVAQQLDSCGEVFGKGVQRYVSKRWRAISGCEKRKLKGTVQNTTNCRPADGTVTDVGTAGRLDRARTKLQTRTLTSCSGPLPALGPGCDGAANAQELVDCVTAPAQEADTNSVNVDTLIETIYHDNVTLSDAEARRCVQGLARAAGAYRHARMRTMLRCELQTTAGESAGPCPNDTAEGKLDAARIKFAKAVRRRCGTTNLVGTTAPKFGLPCEQYQSIIFKRKTPGSNANGIFLVDRLIRCMADTTAEAADQLINIPLPGTEVTAFTSGVAAGDATDSSAVFWTRLPDSASGASLDIATDAGFAAGVQTLALSAAGGADGTVKADVGGLSPATEYFYRFRQGAATSATGTVRTAPPTTDSSKVLRFGWTGDSNAFFQPFNVLDVLREKNLDAWFYIGDTIYGDDPRADGLAAVTTPEYFAKYRANRSDASLRNLMAHTGTYVQWDDHEVLNDFSGTVSAFATQMAAGNLAFRLYNPIRENLVDPMQLYRSTRWGSGAEFFMLDDRQYRSPKIVCCNPPDPPIDVIEQDPGLLGECPLGGQALLPNAACQAALADPTRTYLGAAQKAWLENGLLNSTASFKFIMNGPPITELQFQPYDRWEAYPAERSEILDLIETNNIKNVIWLSTDFHAIIFSGERVDIAESHFVPEIVSGAIGEDSIFREINALAPFVASLIPSFPAFFPQIDEFDLDRFNAVVVTVDPTVSPVTARFDFVDRTGAVITSRTFSATP